MLDANDLKKAPILKHLNDANLKALAAIAEEREFGAGAAIFAEGDKQDSLFIILSGDVRISKATHSGESKSIATLEAGSFFGEMALFGDNARSATATAAGKVRAVEVTKEAFMKFLASDAAGASKLMLEIIRTIAPRIRQTNVEVVALYEAGRVIGERAELGEILSKLLGILGNATSSKRGAVFLFNAGAGFLECRAAFGYDADSPGGGPSGWTEPLTGGIAEEILRTDGSIEMENFRENERFKSIQPVGYETASMLGVALRAQGQPIGMIVLCDKADHNGKPAPFTSGDANLLAGVAAQASGAIESARLHEEAREKEKLDRVYFRY